MPLPSNIFLQVHDAYHNTVHMQVFCSCLPEAWSSSQARYLVGISEVNDGFPARQPDAAAGHEAPRPASEAGHHRPPPVMLVCPSSSSPSSPDTASSHDSAELALCVDQACATLPILW